MTERAPDKPSEELAREAMILRDKAVEEGNVDGLNDARSIAKAAVKLRKAGL